MNGIKLSSFATSESFFEEWGDHEHPRLFRIKENLSRAHSFDCKFADYGCLKLSFYVSRERCLNVSGESSEEGVLSFLLSSLETAASCFAFILAGHSLLLYSGSPTLHWLRDVSRGKSRRVNQTLEYQIYPVPRKRPTEENVRHCRPQRRRTFNGHPNEGAEVEKLLF